ncbi:MAG TPA: nucleotidyltransferase [Chloroflexota bacterium]|nr:nucleotidyltransferase [Chloroflexota bacterium]
MAAGPATDFYVATLHRLKEAGIPFLVGGAYALGAYADIYRETKDFDIFCRAADYPAILGVLSEAGWRIEVTDANWLAKAFYDGYYVDLIFNSHNGLCPVDDSWFEHAPASEVLGVKVRLVPPEEVIWTKVYVQDRHRFDGADVYHIIRKIGAQLDWERLLQRFAVHWQLLLGQLLTYRFVYPSDAHQVPAQVMQTLLEREREQESLPTSQDRICRGQMLSTTQYEIDIKDWGYAPR